MMRGAGALDWLVLGTLVVGWIALAVLLISTARCRRAVGALRVPRPELPDWERAAARDAADLLQQLLLAGWPPMGDSTRAYALATLSTLRQYAEGAPDVRRLERGSA